jgi:hypothetical protein
VSDPHAQCSVCQQVRRVYARANAGVLCVGCYRARQRCARCDRLGIGSSGGLCWSCLLADRVAELRARAGPDRNVRLAGYLDALAASPNAESTLRWTQTPSFAVLEAVVDGQLQLSHQAFDQAQGAQGEGSAVAYLRAALVAHGALPARDETAAAFARWLARALVTVPDGPDHAAITAFATWQIARRLAGTTARHRGQPPPSASKHARAQVREAIRLTRWLHTQALQLGDLRQDMLDEWLADGASTRRSVSAFIDWLGRAHPSPQRLQITWPPAATNPPIASDEQRLDALTALLADRRFDPRVRFAAAAVLLFAQPLTRIAVMRLSDVVEVADGWLIRFGSRPVHAPPTLDDVLEEMSATVPSRTAASASDWLLPGRKHGAHITSEELRRQLKVLGMPVRPGRRGALLALAAELPAPVLAEHFGVHRARAAQWTRAAGRTYADYVADRTVTGHR